MDEIVNEELIQDSDSLKPCRTCGRTFNPQSLERHEKICEKTKTKPRKVFNSFLQRAKETGAVPAIVDKKEEKLKPKMKWKEDHENLINIVRSNTASSKPVTSCTRSTSLKTLPSASGYIQCPTCTRCFSQKAADRHMSWCQEQRSRMPKTPPNSDALERFRARIKYRAPLPGRKRSKESERLIKSADFIRGPSILRTHSSPPVQGRNFTNLKCNSSTREAALLQRRKSPERNSPYSSTPIINKKHHTNVSQTHSKKSVKFKEKFPDYDKQRTTCDMLKALRIQLSKLDTSDDYIKETSYRPSTNEHYLNNNRNNSTVHKLNTANDIQYPWTIAEEVICSTSSSSDGSLPSLSRGGSSERRMPRFCYNCGTKYPIVSAKFCCECGARRLIVGAKDNYLHDS